MISSLRMLPGKQPGPIEEADQEQPSRTAKERDFSPCTNETHGYEQAPPATMGG